ncbi:MAG TPA: hypothetical protein VNA13_00135 [Xanthomonadales bacterium]|nr:hypothetical protein [Xanthomonadales bacterium]
MDIVNNELAIGNVALLEHSKTPQDPIEGLIQSTTEALFARHEGDEESQRVVSRTFQLIRSLRGLTDQDPFLQDRESIEGIARTQKDLIRSMVDATKSDTSPEAVHNTFIIVGILESLSKQNLPSGLHYKRLENANKVRNWWNGIKAEAAIIKALEVNGYRVEIPEGEEIISMDVKGGIDFVAHNPQDKTRVFAVDAKSYIGMINSDIGKRAGGFIVENQQVNSSIPEVETRYPGRTIRKAVVKVDPSQLPKLKLTNQQGELEAIRDFLSLPDSVGKGIIQKLNQA